MWNSRLAGFVLFFVFVTASVLLFDTAFYSDPTLPRQAAIVTIEEDEITSRASHILRASASSAVHVEHTCPRTLSFKVIHNRVRRCKKYAEGTSFCFDVPVSMSGNGTYPSHDLGSLLERESLGRCAVVAHGAGLAECGLEIDSFPVVIRTNCGPARHFNSSDVGSRTTIQLVNHMVAKEINKNPSNAECGKSGKIFMNDSTPVIVYAFDAVERDDLTKFHVREQLERHAFYVAYSLPGLTGLGEMTRRIYHQMQVQGYPTSGLVAIIFAIRHCQHVTVYGYNISSAPVWPGHNFPNETRAISDMVRSGVVEAHHATGLPLNVHSIFSNLWRGLG